MKLFAALAVLAFSGTAVLGSVSATHGNWLLGVGQYEPNSKYDTAGYMFPNANAAAVDKIYFNAFMINAVSTTALTFSNVNPDGGNIYGPTGAYAAALLGYWRDCNGDGYVGLKGGAPTGLGSVGQYSADAAAALGAPVNPAICPAGSAYWPTNEVTGDTSALVDEYRAIGPCQNTQTDCDPDAPEAPPAKVCINPPPNTGGPLFCGPNAIRVEAPNRPAEQPPTDVLDNGSRVWGDWERPAQNHVPYGGLIPMPRGTWQDSDGTLKFIDDATIQAISDSAPDVWESKPNVGACDQPNPTFLGGPGGTCGLWPLYQFARLGNDTTCSAETSTSGSCAHPDPIVTAFDTEDDSNGDGNPCNDFVHTDAAIPNPANPTGPTHLWISLPDPSPSVNENFLADGSISGTLVELNRGLNGTGDPTAAGPGDCRWHANDDNGGLSTNCGIYACESDDQASTFKHVEPTFKMNFTAGSGTRVLAQLGFDHLETETGHFILAQDFSGWYTNTVWTARPPRTGWGAITTTYTTFYADISSQGILGTAATALPGATQDRYTYGSDFCSPIYLTGPSVVNALDWECSRAEWEKVRASLDPNDPTRYNAILGDKYDLRDVDCYDNTVNEDLDPSIKLGVVDCATDSTATHVS